MYTLLVSPSFLLKSHHLYLEIWLLMRQRRPPRSQHATSELLKVIKQLLLLTLFRFTKKWSWSGDLFIDTAEAAEKLCEITISDSSETSNIGFRLGLILDSKDSIRFSKTYKRFELNNIFHALKRVDQIAKITPREERDSIPLNILMKYLSQRKLVSHHMSQYNESVYAKCELNPDNFQRGRHYFRTYCGNDNLPLD